MSLTVIKPSRPPFSFTTGSFSIRWRCRMPSASSSVVPFGTVTRPSEVIRAETGWARLLSKSRSRLVMMPTSLPSSATTGTPLIEKRAISLCASPIDAVGLSVIGSRIIPLSDRLTRSTSSACRSTDMFLWTTPTPPSRAMAMAMPASVTVSMAAETRGTRRAMRRVSRVATSTSLGCTSECPGTNSTSSKVSASGNAPAGARPCMSWPLGIPEYSPTVVRRRRTSRPTWERPRSTRPAPRRRRPPILPRCGWRVPLRRPSAPATP